LRTQNKQDDSSKCRKSRFLAGLKMGPIPGQEIGAVGWVLPAIGCGNKGAPNRKHWLARRASPSPDRDRSGKARRTLAGQAGGHPGGTPGLTSAAPDHENLGVRPARFSARGAARGTRRGSRLGSWLGARLAARGSTCWLAPHGSARGQRLAARGFARGSRLRSRLAARLAARGSRLSLRLAAQLAACPRTTQARPRWD
jgi:hypothetical protein